MKPDDIELLVEVVHHCDEIVRRIDAFGIDESLFGADGAYRDVVLLPLIQIGELVHKISPDLCDEVLGEGVAYQIYGFRNVIVHGYGTIDTHAAWMTVAHDVPELRERLLLIPEVASAWNALSATSDRLDLGSLIRAGKPFAPHGGDGSAEGASD